MLTILVLQTSTVYVWREVHMAKETRERLLTLGAVHSLEVSAVQSAHNRTFVAVHAADDRVLVAVHSVDDRVLVAAVQSGTDEQRLPSCHFAHTRVGALLPRRRYRIHAEIW